MGTTNGTGKEIITMDMYRRMPEYKAGGRLRATRTGKYGMLSRDEDDCREPLLFENDDPAAAGWSSNCMIDCCYYIPDSQTDGGYRIFFGARADIKEACSRLEIRLLVYEEKTGAFRELRTEQGTDISHLSCDMEWEFTGSEEEIAGYIPYAEFSWTDQTGAHNACQVSRFQYQLDELLSKYEHAWPKKEDTAQVFNPSSAIGGEDVMLYPIALMCGCLAEDTMILMGDGVWKRICDIRIGDRIMQPDDGLPILVQNVWRGREKELIMIRTLDGGFVEMTEEHPVRQESGFIRAGELKPGDTVYGEGGRTMTVVSVRKESYNGSVYNLDLQRDGRNVGNGYFLANGIAVGDNRMQNGL